jgi:hypothetical protein
LRIKKIAERRTIYDDAAADFPSRRRETMSGDASDDESVDSFWDNSDSDSEDDVACWALDSVRLFREQDVEPPAELAGGLKAVDLDAMFGYAVRPNPRVTEEERWKESDAEPVVLAPAATAVIEGAGVPLSTIASHHNRRRCHDGGTARPRSPRARPTSSLRERPGRVRSCSSSPLDLTSGGPARGFHAPPGPNGLLQGRHVPPALLHPTSFLLLPRVSFPLLPSAHKELYSIDTHTAISTRD